MSTIFASILKGDIPCDKVYEDDKCIVIHDISPVAPVHVLVIPRKAIASIEDVTTEDADLMGHLMVVVSKVAIMLDLETGYRVVINNGVDGLQSVHHIHIHLLGGRGFSWPPG